MKSTTDIETSSKSHIADSGVVHVDSGGWVTVDHRVNLHMTPSSRGLPDGDVVCAEVHYDAVCWPLLIGCIVQTELLDSARLLQHGHMTSACACASNSALYKSRMARPTTTATSTRSN